MPSIITNTSLKPYNTFGINVNARYFTVLSAPEHLQDLIHSDLFKHERRLILGSGSNVLFTDDFNGLVMKNELKGIAIVAENDEKLELKVSSGEIWHELVAYCVARNWGGIENLSLIPGTTGAAPMQNIGAYGVEVKDCIKEVEAIDLSNGNIISFTNQQCAFGYRESVFKHSLKEKFFISSITLTLTKKNHRYNINYGAIQDVLRTQHHNEISLRSISESVIQIRRSKLPDPAHIGNAGSFFKNPTIDENLYSNLKKEYPTIPGYFSVNQEVKVPAAWLIEQCGWKGKRIREVGVHTQQALVLVNYGDGKGNEIVDLAMQISSSVKEKFQITLTPEVNIISGDE